MRYRVILQPSEEGYSVCCPGLPGCWSEGANEQEAIDNIQHAIRDYLAAIADSFRDSDAREIEVSI